jgi:hypothetical protein
LSPGPASHFDLGSGVVNTSTAINPGIIFKRATQQDNPGIFFLLNVAASLIIQEEMWLPQHMQNTS